MKKQDSLATTLYSQLLEEALANEYRMYCPDIHGAFTKESRRNGEYWYWVGRKENKVSRIYLGTDNAETREMVQRLQQRKIDAVDAISALQKTTKAYLSAGGIPNEPSHFKIIRTLAERGLFQKNVLLIGSHAFLSICNALGIDSKGSYLRTTDIDFARPEGIEIGIPNDRSLRIDIPSIAKEFDQNFFLVPRMDNKEPSTSMQNNTLKIKIDFLTTESKNGKAFFYPDLGIAAEPLAYMGYLLGGDNFKGLVIGKYAIPVALPDPARFAIHKLIVSEIRPTVFRSKSIKDIQQSGLLLDFLIDETVESVKQALEDCRSIGGAIKNIQKALPKLQKANGDAADFISDFLDGSHGLNPF